MAGPAHKTKETVMPHHTPTRPLWIGLAAAAFLWLLLLPATQFSIVTVSIGLLLALAVVGR